jgi:hypothetical protein
LNSSIRKLIPLFIVLELVLSSIPYAISQTNNSFSESMDVYVAGNHALWTVTFTNINVSKDVRHFEQVPGINSFNITALNTLNWLSDFQIFGPYGYNTLELPFIPNSGVFLSVVSSGRDASDKLASEVGSYLYTQFTLISSSGNKSLYFAPISFSEIIPYTLLKLIPSTYGGFSTLINTTTFTSQSSPVIQLYARNSGNSFSYTLRLSSIANSVLTSSGSMNILSVIGTTKKFISSSNISTSSSIRIIVLDGIILSSDNATVSNNLNEMRGMYLLKLKSSERIYKLNITISQQQASLLVKRVIDNGSPEANKPFSVTISFTNISNKTVYNVTLSDNWYKKYSFFKIQSGSPEIKIDNITSGQTVSRTYVLNYTGGAVSPVIVNPEKVEYTYKVGSTNIQGSSFVNGAVLTPGQGGPALYAYVFSQTSTVSAGSMVHLTLSIFNVGSSPALNVSVAGQSVQTIPQAGGSWTLTTNIQTNLSQVSVNKQYVVTFYTPDGRKENVTTNNILISVEHNAIKFPFAQVSYDGSLVQKGSSYNLTLTISVSNKGTVNMTSFNLKGSLPSSLGCGKLSGKNITCSNNSLLLHYSIVKPGQTQRGSISYILNSSGNLLLNPLNYTYNNGLGEAEGKTNMIGFPTGIRVGKLITPSLLFNGMKANVSVSILNAGPGSFSNITLSTSQDSFDSILSSTTSVSNRTLTSGKRLSLSYSVSISSSSQGSRKLSPVDVSLIYAGRSFTLSIQNGTADLLPSPFASVKTSVTHPVEGKTFYLLVNITNPSTVQVSDIKFSFSVPKEITVLSAGGGSYTRGNLELNVQMLNPRESKLYNISLVSNSGSVLDLTRATLTFIYSGQTLNGIVPKQGVIIGENVTSRYILPSLLAIISVLAASFYVRYRMVRRS